MSDPVKGERDTQPAGRRFEAAGEMNTPDPADPMAQATEIMRRLALERPGDAGMPAGGMPEHEIEVAPDEAGDGSP